MRLSLNYFLLVILASASTASREGENQNLEEDIDEEEVHSIRFKRQSAYWRGSKQFQATTTTTTTEKSDTWSQNAGGGSSWNQNAGGGSWNQFNGQRQQYNNLPECPPEGMQDEEPEFGNKEYYSAAKVNNFINCQPYPEQNWPSRPVDNDLDGWGVRPKQYTTTRRTFTRLHQAPTKAPYFEQETSTMRRSGYYVPGTQAPPMPTADPTAPPPNYKYYDQNQMRQPYVVSTHAPFFWYQTEQPAYPAQTPEYTTQRPVYPVQTPGYQTERPRYPNQHQAFGVTERPGYTTQPTSKYPVPGYGSTSTKKYGTETTQKWTYPRFTEKQTPVTESYISTKRYPAGGYETYETPKSTSGSATSASTKRYPADGYDPYVKPKPTSGSATSTSTKRYPADGYDHDPYETTKPTSGYGSTSTVSPYDPTVTSEYTDAESETFTPKSGQSAPKKEAYIPPDDDDYLTEEREQNSAPYKTFSVFPVFVLLFTSFFAHFNEF